MFEGKENAIAANHLKSGETCILTGYGQSMTPKIKSGQKVKVIPVYIRNHIFLQALICF